ncbi:MAG: glycerol-3-phosphate acyltransferase [Chloroflexota bacterium]|jgi:acyl phosphate:glycerol-3-phosphate acyltransferase
MAELGLQLLWTLLSFFLGALPFSVWVGQRASGHDIREVGDKNPGATNVFRSAGFLWFTLAMVLDISKAAAPVGLAYHVFDWRGWPMWLIAMAPVLGHAFSPFLDWRGGKAVAAAFGTWIGLSIWSIPLVALLSLTFWFAMLTVSGWAVILALVTILAYLVFFQPDPLLIAVAAGQLASMSYTHRTDLGRRPGLRITKRRSSHQT